MQVGEGIAARIIVVLILPHVAAEMNIVFGLIRRVQAGAILKV